ncbi:MAG: winged helix-turn-helix transcriptional regulator [Chitinophagaceae bacterium]|nr:winged helix-turn-helix transcriptional regulator [Chitinophagaceae bacterium]
MEDQFSHIASLIGDPVRAKILWALMDGKAYTATELAIQVDTTRPNLSMHLRKLSDAKLLSVEVQGRHRYYAFSRPEVPYALEAMAGLLPTGEAVKKMPVAEILPIAYCRHCYDHLAGKVGVLLTESMVRQKFIVHRGTQFEVTATGVKWFGQLDIDCIELQSLRRSFSRACLDWTERKHHLAGSLGAALLTRMMKSHWLRATAHSRALVVTGKGRKAINELFKVEIS